MADHGIAASRRAGLRWALFRNLQLPQKGEWRLLEVLLEVLLGPPRAWRWMRERAMAASS